MIFFRLFPISFVESKNQVHNCRFELLNKVLLPVLPALQFDAAGCFGAKIGNLT